MSASVGCQTQNALRGPQDMLTMSPREVSFFRAVYSRHTNFASGEAEQSTNNTPAFGRSNIQTTVARAGDLLSQMYLTVHLPRITYSDNSNFSITNGTFTSWTNGIGYAMIHEISAMIGQHEFDTQSGRYMYMRELVSRKAGHKLTEEVGLYDNIAQAAIHSLVPQKLHIPLQFWFNNWLEQSLPMIGLYWHELRMDLSLRAVNQLTQAGWNGDGAGQAGSVTTPANFDELHYLCNFQYLDRPERAMFANQKLEQIFAQVQYLGEESYLATDTYKQVNIRWNQPVTDLMYVFQREDAITAKNWLDFSGVRFAPIIAGAVAPFSFPAQSMHAPPYQSAQIFLNNNQRTVKLSVENLSTLPAQRGHYRVPHGKFVGMSYICYAFLHTNTMQFSLQERTRSVLRLMACSTLARSTFLAWTLRTFALSCGPQPPPPGRGTPRTLPSTPPSLGRTPAASTSTQGTLYATHFYLMNLLTKTLLITTKRTFARCLWVCSESYETPFLTVNIY